MKKTQLKQLLCNEKLLMNELEIDEKKELSEILASAKKKFEASPLRLDYLNVVDARTLQPVSKIESMAVICIAAFCDEVRLIDNLLLYPN